MLECDLCVSHSSSGVMSVWQTRLLLLALGNDGLAGTVGTQLRGILALDGGNARGELTGIGHPHVIADDAARSSVMVTKSMSLLVLMMTRTFTLSPTLKEVALCRLPSWA